MEFIRDAAIELIEIKIIQDGAGGDRLRPATALWSHPCRVAHPHGSRVEPARSKAERHVVQLEPPKDSSELLIKNLFSDVAFRAPTA